MSQSTQCIHHNCRSRRNCRAASRLGTPLRLLTLVAGRFEETLGRFAVAACVGTSNAWSESGNSSRTQWDWVVEILANSVTMMDLPRCMRWHQSLEAFMRMVNVRRGWTMDHLGHVSRRTFQANEKIALALDFYPECEWLAEELQPVEMPRESLVGAHTLPSAAPTLTCAISIAIANTANAVRILSVVVSWSVSELCWLQQLSPHSCFGSPVSIPPSTKLRSSSNTSRGQSAPQASGMQSILAPMETRFQAASAIDS
jgi:hypothetical protein